ncbi:aspartic proteinase CDR1-like [Coffea eugenioides]|uniref:Aspartic proteinase CDR1 n=1 Tax=Coffea arabica TaxID=13443 RepID=A0A6P6S923_COFAR|nr:aspartic proteinase CDR1-like [Coffea eugenioides]
MAANFPVFSMFSKLSLLVFINLFFYPLIEGKDGGFSTHLIHRDSPKSPLRNPSNSFFEMLNKSFHRSFARAEYFKKRVSQSRSKHSSNSSSAPIQSHITSAGGEYLIKVTIGTPPVDFLAIADTGSDLTWIQCKPCKRCYKQDAPLFDPNKTTTYRHLSCNSPLCSDPGTTFCDFRNKCGYRVSYGDGSFSNGDLSTETFTFESCSTRNVSIPNVAFGCGQASGGIFQETSSGIVGLGGGALSIIKQLNGSIGGKFSYCLVPRDSNFSSKINFGSNAVVSGPGVLSTPLIKQYTDTFYYLNLTGFSVGNTRIPYDGLSKPDNSSPNDFPGGNIIIDSGTTLTFVLQDFYQRLEAKVIKITRGTRVSDPGGQFSLCYKVEKRLKIPKIVAHFANADIKLPPDGTFLEVSKGIVCLAIVPTDGIAIFGNVLQINHLIGYDLVNKKLSFLPTSCTKYK